MEEVRRCINKHGLRVGYCRDRARGESFTGSVVDKFKVEINQHGEKLREIQWKTVNK